ncbi:acyl carrier protein [Streptomyces sp. NBC_00250]|uniref:acyl carrier protein n=1 Tax=unclassified Streptomyces TaxID=2593676 RepID=UPI002259148E|nr:MULTISPECIES: acyl carrier protein [unclassified Streptomyces]MCX4984949.1 acyl carrier protein [Streptomyces sp. NBC_00572]
MSEQTGTELDLEALRVLIAEILDVDVAEVSDDAHFVNDLGVDSLMALEITVRLEQEFSVTLAEEELQKISTLATTHALLEETLRAAS